MAAPQLRGHASGYIYAQCTPESILIYRGVPSTLKSILYTGNPRVLYTSEENTAADTRPFHSSECLYTRWEYSYPLGSIFVKRRKLQLVWSCLPFIRSGQNHLARHSERGKKTRQTEEEVGRQHQGMDRPRVRQFCCCCG